MVVYRPVGISCQLIHSLLVCQQNSSESQKRNNDSIDFVSLLLGVPLGVVSFPQQVWKDQKLI